METGDPTMDATRWELGRHNSHSSLAQEPGVDEDKAKDKVFVTRKRKRNEKEKQESIIYLPREVLVDILLLLPAEVLQDVVRYVCKEWYDIVSDSFFVRTHCQMTTTTSVSFIFQSNDNLHKVYCADQDGAKSVKVTKIHLPFATMIQGSCNGLILLSEDPDIRMVHVMNPVRRLILSLPPVVPTVLWEPIVFTTYGFAVNSSGQYKAVHISLYNFLQRLEMSVFTIGVDKAWRPIDFQDDQGIPLNFIAMIHSLTTRGLLIAGFLYWCSNNSVSLAMDVDTETLYPISWPKSIYWRLYDSYFISMGTALGLMVEVNYKRGIWKLLRLTDVKSSEWTEIDMIDIGAMVSKVSNFKWTTYEDVPIKPVSLIDGGLCFYCGVSPKSSWLIRYNLATESFMSFGLNIACHDASCFHHVPTLVSPKNATLNSFKT